MGRGQPRRDPKIRLANRASRPPGEGPEGDSRRVTSSSADRRDARSALRERRRVPSRGYDEEGIGLVDVSIAITVLLLVLVPAALLLASINSTSGSTNHRVVALGVASSYIDEVQ